MANHPIGQNEVKEAISKLNKGKSAGTDILGEFIKKGGTSNILKKITHLFSKIWQHGRVLKM